MPPAFSAQERERIVARLRATGYRLFTTQGLRKTSLEELVRPAGIAKSSFYAFYDSKEELYIDLMYQQLPEVRERMLATLREESVDVSERLRRLLRGALEVQRDDPLYRRLLTHPDEMEAVTRKHSPERLAEAKQSVVTPILEFLEDARRRGRLVDVDPVVVLGVIQAVLTVPLREEMFDPDTYEPALELLVDLVATGLTRPRS